LAHHYEAAAQLDEPVRAKAVETLLQAGRAAARRYATEPALGFADRALALAQADHERLVAFELRARSFHAAIRSDDALASYLDALEVAHRMGDREATARLRAYATLLCARYSGALTGES